MDPVSQVRQNWAGRLAGSRAGGAGGAAAAWERHPQPLPHALLSLSRLVPPKLASAGTFRVLKEPLAFLRALELVSSSVCVQGGAPGSEPSGEERWHGVLPAPFCSKPEIQPSSRRFLSCPLLRCRSKVVGTRLRHSAWRRECGRIFAGA